MSLLKKIIPSTHCIIILWNINEEINEMEKAVSELNWMDEEYFRIKNLQRKKQWLCERIVLTMGAEEILSPNELNSEKINLYHDENGKPFLNKPLFISISHSEQFLVLILNSMREVGIDIQIIKEKIKKIVPKYLSNTEISDIEKDINYYNKLHLYWSAKETIYKWYGEKKLGFKKNISIEPFSIKKEGVLKGKLILPGYSTLLNLKYIVESDFVLTYIC